MRYQVRYEWDDSEDAATTIDAQSMREAKRLAVEAAALHEDGARAGSFELVVTRGALSVQYKIDWTQVVRFTSTEVSRSRRPAYDDAWLPGDD